VSFRSLLNKRAAIQRMMAEKDAQGVVSANPTWQTVGTYPCSTTESSSAVTQGTPQAKQSIVYTLCFMISADIRAGDLAIIPGIGKLRLGKPYDVRGHHWQVSGVWEGDM